MKIINKKWFPIILVSISCILFITAIVITINKESFTFNNNQEQKENNKNNIKEEENNKVIENNDTNINNNDKTSINENNDTIIESSTNNTTNANNSTVKNDKVEEQKEVNTTNNENSNQTKNEVDIISYFESQEKLITTTSNQNDSSIREKAKNAFVTIIDFIFYNKEIKGYTFSELTTTAKLKVIKIALSIDNKIDKYFPDYKDVIKDKYNNIKGKLAVKYLEFTSTLCDNVGDETCNQAKEDFNTMKKNFGITWQLIKELASSGSSKVKEFYESWRDK